MQVDLNNSHTRAKSLNVNQLLEGYKSGKYNSLSTKAFNKKTINRTKCHIDVKLFQAHIMRYTVTQCYKIKYKYKGNKIAQE